MTHGQDCASMSCDDGLAERGAGTAVAVLVVRAATGRASEAD